MSYFSEIDYSYYGDREDPETNARYYLNQVIMTLDPTKSEKELLNYNFRYLCQLYRTLLEAFTSQANKALTDPRTERQVLSQVKSIARLKRTILGDENYVKLYEAYEKTAHSISSQCNRTLKLMNNTSIKS